MQIILQLPEVERNKFIRPKKCPYCKGETFQGWGRKKKRIKDTRVKSVQVRRYKCTSCQKTFRQYPKGVTRAQQSERLIKLCVVMWSLGLSYRSVVLILSAFGICLSHMSGWRSVQAAGRAIQRKMRWKPARIVGVDGMWLNKRGIMVAVDLGEGSLLALAEIDEKDKDEVQRWLKDLKQRHGIGAIVSDDLASYKEIAEELELGHQVCQFHVRRWVGRALKKLKPDIPPEWQYVLEEIEALIDDLPSKGGKRLHEIWKRMPGRTTKPNEERTPMEKLRDMVLRLSRDWESYIAFYDDAEMPWTNNQTEQMIGRIKNRAKRVRGYKSVEGMLNGNLMAGQTWT